MSATDGEGVLIARLKRGDGPAVADLAAAYGAWIARIAIRYVKNREDAEEVTQDVLLKASRAIGTFRGDAALGSWIFRITFNAAMSRLRHRQAPRRQEVPSDDRGAEATRDRYACTPPADVADWSSLPDETYLRCQFRERLRDALRTLPHLYRAPVELRDVRGLSTEEASHVLGVTSKTLKSRLHRGRTLLRSRLADFRTGLSLHRAARVVDMVAVGDPPGTGG